MGWPNEIKCVCEYKKILKPSKRVKQIEKERKRTKGLCMNKRKSTRTTMSFSIHPQMLLSFHYFLRCARSIQERPIILAIWANICSIHPPFNYNVNSFSFSQLHDQCTLQDQLHVNSSSFSQLYGQSNLPTPYYSFSGV